ncbi:hypothetical protein DFH07DRAFT_967634 [Mycena maculata]|uniref:Uncharacterized protein n=1 Tax=Mycena maculata TaxID=230809 RepID=A0AAD7I3Z1_9AGAR|nr:hypothetical protein DFH07DRAFT_967634 [Mycena maculata]
MSDLCGDIERLIDTYNIVVTQLADPDRAPSTPEKKALKRLLDTGIKIKAPKAKKATKKKATKDKDTDNPPPKKTDAELDQIADERILALLPDKLPPPLTPQDLIQLILHPSQLTTPAEQDDFLQQAMRGFAAPEGSWTPILTAAGLHSNQRVTVSTVTAAATAAVPGDTIPLVTVEDKLLSFIKTTGADFYATTRIVLCETMCTQATWSELSNVQKGAHNRELFIAQNPSLFDDALTHAQKHAKLTRGGELLADMNRFLRNDREPLTRARTQIYNLGQVFGFAAIIHPAASLDSLGRPTAALSRISARLHLGLNKRPDLCREIEARAAGNLNVIRELLRGLVVIDDKDAVREYLTDYRERVTFYRYD